MRKRILRHLNQRSEMLSGISHDLRTPLTRMKLQIAFIEDKELSKKLSEDINEMEKMLNEYLQFTSSSYLEKDEEFNISELVDEIVKKYSLAELMTHCRVMCISKKIEEFLKSKGWKKTEIFNPGEELIKIDSIKNE